MSQLFLVTLGVDMFIRQLGFPVILRGLMLVTVAVGTGHVAFGVFADRPVLDLTGRRFGVAVNTLVIRKCDNAMEQ